MLFDKVQFIQRTSQNVSGFNSILLSICKGFKCVKQFITLVEIYKIETVENYFCIIDAYKPI